jgi:hypothetical protein
MPFSEQVLLVLCFGRVPFQILLRMSTAEKKTFFLPEIFVESMIFYWMGRRGLNRLGPQSCVPHHPVHFKGTG